MSNDTASSTVFVFSGHGSQWFGMGTQLMMKSPVFHSAIERFDEYIKMEAGWSLIDFLRAEKRDARWDDLSHMQLSLIAIEIALARVWESRGVIPDAVVGQSLGEVAAACVAGALTEADAIRVVVASNESFAYAKPGGMMLVGLNGEKAARVAAEHPDRVHVAGFLSQNFSVLAGDVDTLKRVGRELRNEGVLSQRIKVDAAIHCPYVEPCTGPFRESLASLVPHQNKIPFYSSSAGKQLSGTELDGEHWVRLISQPMQFKGVMDEVLTTGPCALVEVSPRAILTGMIEDIITARPDAANHHIMITQKQNEDPLDTFKATQGRLKALRPVARVVQENEREPLTEEQIQGAFAIVGMACRLPGGINNTEDFWEMLRTGREVIEDAPEERWNAG